MDNIVSNLTVKALQEFDTGEMEAEEEAPAAETTNSRPSSSRPQSAAKGSRPGSATKKSSRPPTEAEGENTPPRLSSAARMSQNGSPQGSVTSAKGRPGSGGSVRSSKAGSRPGSAKGSRPGSATSNASKTDSVQREPAGGLVIEGSRAGSAAGSIAADEQEEDRPASAVRPPSGSPGSRNATPASGRASSGRPTSGRPGSGRPASGRPTSGRPASGRPASGRPASGQPESGRQASGSPGSGRQSTGASRVGSARPVSRKDGDWPETDRPVSVLSSGRPQSRGRSINSPQRDDNENIAHDDRGVEEEPVVDNTQTRDPGVPPQTREVMPPPGQTLDLMGPPPPGSGDPDGGDGYDGESAEEEENMEDEDDDSDESEGEAEMVLDPNHPLMARFQSALKAHLDKVDERVTLEYRELLEAVKNRKKEREDLGVDLYGVQQELARHQMMLEKGHDEFANVQQERLQEDQSLRDVRDQYKDHQMTVSSEKKKGSELQTEVENLALRIQFVEHAKEDIRSDIAVMRRAAEKAEQEVSSTEVTKHKQDLFVDKLVERVDKLREEIAMYEAQLSAQGDETKSAKEALSEAYMEIEAITLEKKQLFQQWNSSLIGMRRRDEAHAAMLEALNQQQQRILSLETEIDGYKKSIQKEQEQNEKLTVIHNKTETDITTVRKLLQMCQDRHDALKNEYSTYTRMLHETEQALSRATTDKTLRMNELNALRKQIEREYLEKVRLEDEILEKLRSKLTMEKASHYTDKLTGKLRNRTRDLETQMATVENDISKDSLELSYTCTRIERIKKILNDLDEEIRGKNAIISKSETEITRRNAIIERKQGVIDQYNKKLEHMIAQAGGEELGPLEIQINSLQKSIAAEQEEIGEMQQQWLRGQSELVRLVKEKEEQSTHVELLKKQLTILTQKKIRIEGDINIQTTETADIERSISNIQNEALKLNNLLHKEQGLEYNLQQGNILMENDFIGTLREAEMKSIQMQSELDGIMEEKERLLNSLVEAERQIMLWEKKTQLARETRNAVDSEVGQGEMRAMKAEIHRMQVRYTQLMKQQERMIQEMEKAVSRRDTIVTRGDAQSKMNKKVLTKGTFQRQMGETKKKIKHTIQEANACDLEIRDYRNHQQELSTQLEERQLDLQQLQGSADTLDGDLDRLLEQKHKNLLEILSKQQRSKYYQQVKDNRYSRLCKTEGALETERQKNIDRMQTVMAICDRLSQEYPHVQPTLRKATMPFSSRVQE